MLYPTKTALILRRDLAPWQIANVSAFLTGGLAGKFPEIVGEPYRDASGQGYAPLIREPVFVYGGEAADLARTHGRALSRGLVIAIYTAPLFNTNNDVYNRASVAREETGVLDLVGLGLHGARKVIDKVIHGLKFLA